MSEEAKSQKVEMAEKLLASRNEQTNESTKTGNDRPGEFELQNFNGQEGKPQA